MSLWFFSPEDDAGGWRRALETALPDLRVVDGETPDDPSAVRYALVHRPPRGVLASLPRLEVVFSLAAGVDSLLADPTLPSVPVCRMVDPAMNAAMADYVLLAVLRVQRRFDLFERRFGWDFAPPRLAHELAVTVLGLGEIGASVARRLAAHGYRVAGWSRAPRRLDDVTTFAGADRLPAAIGDADVVVALLPGTPATRDLFDDTFFASLKPGSHFINVGRGDQLVEPALLAALDAGRVSGATLDVFRDEPLPPAHPFWTHPAILVTPHVAAIPRPETGVRAVVDNIGRVRNGLPPRHVIDRERGY